VKTCPDCGEEKPQSAFGRKRSLPDGLFFPCRDWCRQSREGQGKQVRDHSWVPGGFRWCPTCQQPVAHVDHVRSRTTPSGFGSQCKACRKKASSDGCWRRRYGLSKTAVDRLRKAQDDRCPICGDAAPEHLDRDHESGRVRALLCQRCNFGLGLHRDDPDLLRAAAEYVERHRQLERRHRPRPLARRRDQVIGRPGRPPVGSQRRPQVTRRTGLCSRGRALLAAREAGA
jgi:hypothetical protein